MDEGPARLYVGVVGAALVVVGIIGFFYNSTFTDDEAVRDAVFGILDVNGWHNVVHIVTGLGGLVAFSWGAYASRQYALIFGLAYIGVAVWGFIEGDGGSLAGIVPINTEDNFLHAAVGAGGVIAALAPPIREPDSPAPAT